MAQTYSLTEGHSKIRKEAFGLANELDLSFKPNEFLMVMGSLQNNKQALIHHFVVGLERFAYCTMRCFHCVDCLSVMGVVVVGVWSCCLFCCMQMIWCC